MLYPTLCLFYKRHTDGTIVGDFDNKITVRFIFVVPSLHSYRIFNTSHIINPVVYNVGVCHA